MGAGRQGRWGGGPEPVAVTSRRSTRPTSPRARNPVRPPPALRDLEAIGQRRNRSRGFPLSIESRRGPAADPAQARPVTAGGSEPFRQSLVDSGRRGQGRRSRIRVRVRHPQFRRRCGRALRWAQAGCIRTTAPTAYSAAGITGGGRARGVRPRYRGGTEAARRGCRVRSASRPRAGPAARCVRCRAGCGSGGRRTASARGSPRAP